MRQLLAMVMLVAFTASNACAWPLNTFGYDYGFPRVTENQEFIGQHHDVIIGPGEWQEKYIIQDQWDVFKAQNPDVTLIPYTVIQAFTFQEMQDFFVNYTINMGTGDTENLYHHYTQDQIILVRTAGERTCGDGSVPGDRICESDGTLVPNCGDGDLETYDCTECRSNYYISWGWDGDADIADGSSAPDRISARTWQFWNAGFEPRMNHLSSEWQAAYPEYLVTVTSVDQDENTGLFSNGVYLDTYTGIVDVDGYLPNMNQLESVIQEWGNVDDMTARNNYSETFTQFLNTTVGVMRARLSLPAFHFVANYGDMGYIHGSSAQFDFAYEDFNNNVANGVHAIEYLTSPAKCEYWHTQGFFREHYDAYDTVEPGGFWVDQINTAWSEFGEIVPSWESYSFIIGAFWLFKHPNAKFLVHTGTGASYGPGLYPNIGEHKGGTYPPSHWHPLMEWDGGDPISNTWEDYWGITNTNRMYVMEDFPTPGYPVPGRIVMARRFENGMVVVRLEPSDNNTPYSDNYGQAGEEPLTWTLPAPHCLVTDMVNGVPVYAQASDQLTLGLAEGAILGNLSQPGCSSDPVDPGPTMSSFAFRGQTMTGPGLIAAGDPINPNGSPMLNPDASPVANPL